MKADEKQPPSLSDHIAMMNRLASGLKDYGQALVDLANYGDPSGRINTMQEIATNFDTVFQSPVAQSQAKVIGTLLGLVGNQVIEAVKKKNIKEIVSKFRPTVDSAVVLLRASNSRGSRKEPCYGIMRSSSILTRIGCLTR